MSALECDIKLGLTSQKGRSNLTVCVKPAPGAGLFLARLVHEVDPDSPLACLPCNPFVSLDGVARKVGALGVDRHGEVFLIAPAREDALATLLVELDAESILITFGGKEHIDQLRRAASPPWWKFTPSEQYPADIELLMRFAASHGSLDVFSGRNTVLRFFDHTRRLCGLPFS